MFADTRGIGGGGSESVCLAKHQPHGQAHGSPCTRGMLGRVARVRVARAGRWDAAYLEVEELLLELSRHGWENK